jgi:Carboxypeptidase regulatory-like domain/TonB-dependent Receptor Plug Domain
MKIKALMLTAMLLVLAPLAQAQTSRGTVSGSVADTTGAVIPGATVTLTNTDTTLSRTAVTNDEGFYRFDAVDLGTYSLGIAASGFGTVTKTGVIVNANQTSAVDAQLAPGEQQVTVDVVSEAGAALQTEAPVRGGNISTQQVTELPFSTRNPVALALTLPGVSSNRGGFGVGTFSVNGARGRSNNFLIDGTENNDISVAGQGFQITNPDAVQEVAVQTSNYDSEFGRSGGAVVNTITKSGTNQFHGTLSYLLDSRVDDAITSAESRDPDIAANGLPFGIENIYSGTFGGPLYLPRFGEGGRSLFDGRNRTFFFVAYQEDRQRSNTQSQLVTPTAAGRARLRSLFPAGTNANVDTLLDLTQNAVGVASPINIALGTSGGVNRGNIEFGTFFRNFPVLNTDKQFQVRVDSRLTENDQFSVRFLSDRQDQPAGGTVGTSTFEGFDADATNRYYNFLVANTHVFSPVFTNETRLAYNRIQLGFPLSNPGGLAGVLPRIAVTNITSLGASATFPQGRTANNYVVQDTVTYVKGNHTFRGGVDFLRQISTQAAPFNERGSATFVAGGGFTAFANFVDNIGGSGGTAARDIGSAVYFPSMYRTALFFQDRWKASEALTLSLGLRYEYFGTPFNTLRTPAFTGLFNVNPTTGTGPFSQPNQVQKDQNNYAPSFGIAYSPSFTEGMLGRLFGERKTVLRAGYQIGYDSFFNNIASNSAVSSPNIVSTTITSGVTGANPRGTPNFTSLIPTTAAALTPLSAQTLIAQNLVNPYYQRFSAGLQRELPYNLLIDASYVGSKGTKLFINEDVNPLVRPELRITPPGFTGPTQGRLDNVQGTRTVRTNGGSSIYHSGQLEVKRRFANNLTLTSAYTYSKLISNADEVFNSLANGISNSATFQTPAILGGDRLDRGVSLFDRTHRLSFTYVYELPFFREQRGALGHILGGFQISGVTTFESGVPFTVSNGVDADGINGSGGDRPNLNPNGQRGVRAVPVVAPATLPNGSANPDFGRILGYINPDANNAPIDPNTAQFIANPTFISGNPFESGIPHVGTLGRNTERSPGTNNFNINILKRVRVSESARLEFRSEFYNIFNHPQFGQGSVSPFSPPSNPQGANFIASNTTGSLGGLFLRPNTSLSDGGGRVVRYQLKFIF